MSRMPTSASTRDGTSAAGTNDASPRMIGGFGSCAVSVGCHCHASIPSHGWMPPARGKGGRMGTRYPLTSWTPPHQFVAVVADLNSSRKHRQACLVAVADAPTGMGGVPRIDKNGTTYAIYLVETTDPNATPVRLQTTTGTKAIRIKT